VTQRGTLLRFLLKEKWRVEGVCEERRSCQYEMEVPICMNRKVKREILHLILSTSTTFILLITHASQGFMVARPTHACLHLSKQTFPNLSAQMLARLTPPTSSQSPIAHQYGTVSIEASIIQLRTRGLMAKTLTPYKPRNPSIGLPSDPCPSKSETTFRSLEVAL
jgi:hypothetical protein